MKSGRTQVEIIALYQELGSYRAVAAVVGCDHKTVKRYVDAAGDAGQLAPALTRSRVTDEVAEVIAERVEQTHAKITARRLLRVVRAAGYDGSERSLRRAVADAKQCGVRSRLPRAASTGRGSRRPANGCSAMGRGRDGPDACRSAEVVVLLRRVGLVALPDSQLLLQRAFGALAVGLAHSFEQVGGVPGRVLFDNPKTVATDHVAGAAVLNPEWCAWRRTTASHRERPSVRTRSPRARSRRSFASPSLT